MDDKLDVIWIQAAARFITIIYCLISTIGFGVESQKKSDFL